jgi:uncharacterized protein involved in exopolysaccharide biosynthesis
MNARADIDVVLRLDPEWRVEEARDRHPPLTRSPPGRLTPSRLLFGGRLDDAGRLPRYGLLGLLGLALLWGPIVAYLELAPVRYTSSVSLILPGAGAASSVSVAEIGQASSHANSPYASSALSPTVTYQRLLGSARVLEAASAIVGEAREAFGEPRIRLVDQTGLVGIEMRGDDPGHAQARGAALTRAFLAALDELRADEIARREDSARRAIAEDEAEVAAIRRRITALQRETGLASADQFGAIVADRETLAVRLREVDAALERARGGAAALAAALGIDPATASLTMRLHADPEFRALAASMADASARLAEARGAYGERHPTLIAARDDAAGARVRLEARAALLTGLDPETLARRIDLSAEGGRAALMADLVRRSVEADGLAAERAALSAKLAEAKARIDALAEDAAALDDLERDYRVAEAVFASALAKADTAKVDVYASYPLVQVLEPATLPTEPSSPKTLIALAAGLGGSLCLIVALALAWARRPIVGWMLDRATTA